MMKKLSFLLIFIAILLFMEIEGSPVAEADKSDDPKNLKSSRILPTADWLNFEKTWALPSFPSVTSFFYNEDKVKKEAELMKMRIEALEQSQKDIIKMLNKLTQDIKPNSTPLANKKPAIVLPESHKEKPILPAKAANHTKDEAEATENSIINENPVTQESAKPESSMDDKNSGNKNVLTESPSKLVNRTAVSSEKDEKLKSEVKNTNENIDFLDFDSQSKTETKTDDVIER